MPLNEAWYLSQCASKAWNSVVEIGAYRGRSTIALAYGVKASGGGQRVYSVEPHAEFEGAFGGVFGPEDREHFYRNMLKSNLVRFAALVNYSSSAAAAGLKSTIDLLVIDGDHSYMSVNNDARLWLPFLSIRGIVVFDDAIIEGPSPRLVTEELIRSGLFIEIRAAGKLRALRRQIGIVNG